jgi:hypothetical protein
MAPFVIFPPPPPAEYFLNSTDYPPPECPKTNAINVKLDESFRFWVEGIFLCVIAFAGILGNGITSIILCK